MTTIAAPTFVFDAAFPGLESATAAFEKFTKSTAEGALKVAERLEDAAEPLAKLKAGIDAAGDASRVFGRDASLIADAIDDGIADPAKRAREHLRNLERQQTSSARSLRALNDHVAVAKLRLMEFAGGARAYEIAMGAAKIATAAVAGAIAGGLVAAVKLGLESNKRLSASWDKFVVQGKVIVATFGQILLGGNEAAKGVDSLTGRMVELEKTMRTNAPSIRGTFIDIAQGALTAVKWIGQAALGVYTVFKGVGEALGALAYEFATGFLAPMAQNFADFADMAKQLAIDLAVALGPGEAQDNLLNYATSLMGLRNNVQGFVDELNAVAGAQTRWQTGFEQGSDLIDGFTSRIDAANAALEKMRGQKITIDVDRKALGEKTGGKAKGSGFAAQTVTNVDERVKEFADFNKALAEGQLAGANFTNQLAAMHDTANVASRIMGDFGRDLGRGLGQAFLDLGGAISSAMGALLVGQGNFGAFLKSMGGLVADVATMWGELYFKWGLAMSFVDPSRGIPMMLAGVGLQALGKAGGMALAGGGGGGAGRGSRGPSPSLPLGDMRPERDTGPRETTVLVQIAGKTVEAELVTMLDRASVRGAFRHLGRA